MVDATGLAFSIADVARGLAFAMMSSSDVNFMFMSPSFVKS
jgi:hypothetical protein